MVLGNVSLDELEVPFMALFNEAIVGEQEIVFLKKWWHPRYGWAEENGIWQHRAYLVHHGEAGEDAGESREPSSAPSAAMPTRRRWSPNCSPMR